MKVFKTVDLFAGIGGMRLGFESTGGFETVFANDYEPKCKKTYDLNFKNSKLHIKDLREINSNDIPDVEFLLAGFPCQPFSIAGKRGGFNDKKGRGNLFFEIERILKDKKPKGFLLENVKNMEGHDDGKTFKVITDILHNLGYNIKHKVLNSYEYSTVPQNRERIYIVGFLDKKNYEKFNFPIKKKGKTSIKDVLLDLKDVPSKYYYNGKPLYEKIKNDIVKENTAYQWRRVYVRENKSNLFPTLTANMGTGGHNVPIIKQGDIIRKITPRECARVQGFPDSYILPKLADSHLYKQFGNTVSVPVIEKIAKNIYNSMT